MTPHPLDRSPLLHPQNPVYAEMLGRFFEWQLDQDGKDLTTEFLFSESLPQVRAEIVAKEAGVFSGRTEIEFFAKKYEDLKCTWHYADGADFSAGKILLTLQGPTALLLELERMFLNVLARMSGIATVTRRLVSKLPKNIAVAATRKTLWGHLDKKAVAAGGGLTHRLGLFDAVLVKENHAALVPGGVVGAAKKIAGASPEELGAFWEIEVETPAEFQKVWEIATRKDLPTPGVLMLDNFSPEEIKRAVAQIQPEKFPQIFLEASGRITPENIAEFAASGVHILSLGYLTHTAPSIDLSMRIINPYSLEIPT